MPKPRAWISTTALDTLISAAERHYPNETGGLLIGYCTTVDIVIAACTTPGPLARHTSTQYFPDPEHDQAELARHYDASGCRHTYLGDWHTHPDEAPYLSRTDARTLAHIAATPSARAPLAIMTVLGGRPGAWVAAVWRHAPRTPLPLALVSYTAPTTPGTTEST
jgi:integrative and conjugative element protein (TIGR02256 family)